MKQVQDKFNSEQNKGTLFFAKREQKWVGRIWKDNKQLSFYLGSDRTEAVRAFNEILKTNYGDNARLRYIE